MKSFSCFKPRDPFKNWSKELDKRVAVWARNFDSSFKLLLLGPAGAGKTTIMKQMKIIHFEGFSQEERQQKAKEIRTNLLESVRELTACITASGHQIDWHDKENQARLEFINGLNLDDQTYDLYAAKIYDYSKRILTDKGVKDLFAQLNQLSITHRSQYLLNRVDEIRNVNYVPNNDDILQSRRRTSDIQKLEFQVSLPLRVNGEDQQQHQQQSSMKQTFCMFDVGGQRGERRKWIQVFDGVSAVMFLIDSSSFDAIDEENGKNKLKETINLFHEVWTTRFLLNSNFVLLFNKQDILKEKIERGHKIEDHFPEYKLYKMRPNERHLSEKTAQKSGENRFSLFRTVSSSSSTALQQQQQGSPIAKTPVRNSPSRSSFAAGQQHGHPVQSQTVESNAPLARPRKTSSLYSFGASRSRSFFSSKSSAAKQAAKAMAARNEQIDSATISGDLYKSIPGGNERISSSVDAASSKPLAAKFASNVPANASGTSSEHNQMIEQDSHLSYIKARSFIRDKFLQVTRQKDTHLQYDQRKYSSPNLPIYNQKVSTAAGSRVDQPKRNVCYHYTTATDTENIRDLFENLQKMVIKSTMKDL